MVGIAGCAGMIYDCFNLGEIKSTRASKVYSMGGLVGISPSVVEKSYNQGNMNYQMASFYGGVVGYVSSTSGVLNSYYLKGTASGGLKGEDLPGQAEAKEESEMPSVLEVIQNQIEVDGQMINAWKEDTNNINNGYPILYWQ